MRGAGRGRCRGRGGGRRGGCDHTEAGWSKAIRDLVFFFFPAAVWKGLRFEPSHKEEGNHVENEDGGRRAAQELKTFFFFYSPQLIYCVVLSA